MSDSFVVFPTPDGNAFFRLDTIVGARDLSRSHRLAMGASSVLMVGRPTEYADVPLTLEARDVARVIAEALPRDGSWCPPVAFNG